MNEFIHFMEIKKDAMGIAWCTGSGVVFKRRIIDDLGGWPTASMAEDVLLSSMMHGAGYKTAYVHEFLQCGLIPDTIAGHLKQRTRWALGTMQTSQYLNFGLFGKLVSLFGSLHTRSQLIYQSGKTYDLPPTFLHIYIRIQQFHDDSGILLLFHHSGAVILG